MGYSEEYHKSKMLTGYIGGALMLGAIAAIFLTPIVGLIVFVFSLTGGIMKMRKLDKESKKDVQK